MPLQAKTFVAAHNPALQYFGRWDLSAQDMARTGRGATYIRADFTGTSIAVRIQDKDIYWAYGIDNGPLKEFQPQGKETVLAENLPSGRHHLFLIRNTEGEVGISEFSGLSIDDGARVSRTRHTAAPVIEFIGDSITAGFWNKRQGDYPHSEDGYMAFGPQLARLLHADWSVVAKSGEGVMQNYGEKPGDIGPNVHAKETYVRTFYTEEKPEWDFRLNPPQAVVIAYGTNDFVDSNNKPSLTAFAAAYADLVGVVRAKNPAASIICLEPLPSWLGADVRKTIQGVVEAAQSQGDRNVYFIPINACKPLLQKADYSDGNTHPTIQGDTKVAVYLQDKVAKILNSAQENKTGQKHNGK